MAEKKQNTIYETMAAVMADIGAISKSEKNTQQGFSYRGIDSVYNHLHSLFSKHGVFCMPEVLDTTRTERPSKSGGVLAFTTVKIKYTFYAKDGSFVSCVMYGEGMDSGDKSANKALASADKYALLQVFKIPTKENKDADADIPEIAAQAQQQKNGNNAPETTNTPQQAENDYQAMAEKVGVCIDAYKTPEALDGYMRASANYQQLKVAAPDLAMQLGKYAEKLIKDMKAQHPQEMNGDTIGY